MAKSNLKYALTLFGLMVCAGVHAQLVFEGTKGLVTTAEIKGFKAAMMKTEIPVYGGGNVWVYGNPAKNLEACGMMFEVTKDTTILNRMIVMSDALLAGRNDLLPADKGGQHTTWTGNIDPVWPSAAQTVTSSAGAGVEQGQVVARMAYCAKLILKTPAIWNDKIPDGDPHHFGTTYKERALKYIAEGDHVIDAWILPRFIRTSEQNHYYFPGSPNTYKANEPAPWNQAWMLTNGLVRLVECHELLHDDGARIAKYDAIVQPNINWFFSSLRPNQSPAGTKCYTWAYALPKGMEDTNHAAYDCEGLWIAYDSGRYKLTGADLLPFANTYADIVMATVTDGKFAGRVDGTTGTGHQGGDNYVRDEYLYLAEFRPDQFDAMAQAEVNSHKATGSLVIDARLLWLKNKFFAVRKSGSQ